MILRTTGLSLLKAGEPFTKEEGLQIYRLHAQFVRKPSVWREIEIQGNQTLIDLDRILRKAFQHDDFDHLSGFSQRVVRTGGSCTRYREVDLGTVNPNEYSEGSDKAIAGLKLQVGDQLYYVYDFGDNLEHTLDLQSIGSMEIGVGYPREFARNEPKYEYCFECQKNGEQNVGNWICYTCSHKAQREMVLCEKCRSKHEDHFVDKFIY
jgi:hypothetical protein